MDHITTIVRPVWLLLVLPLSGRSSSPAILVLGAALPGWLFCLLGGAFLPIPCHILITHKGRQPCFPPPVLSYVALMPLFATLLWFLLFVH